MFVLSWFFKLQLSLRAAFRSKAVTRRRAREYSSVAAMIEMLEPRKLMSGTPLTATTLVDTTIAQANIVGNAHRALPPITLATFDDANPNADPSDFRATLSFTGSPPPSWDLTWPP